MTNVSEDKTLRRFRRKVMYLRKYGFSEMFHTYTNTYIRVRTGIVKKEKC